MDILERLSAALTVAAGQYTPVTDEQRNEWEALLQEVNSHRWFVTKAGPEPEPPQGDDSA